MRLGVAALAAAVIVAGCSKPGASRSHPVPTVAPTVPPTVRPLPANLIVAATRDGQLVEVDAAGKVTKVLATIPDAQLVSVDVDRARTAVFVSALRTSCAVALLRVSPDGSIAQLGPGADPAVTTDGSTIAYARMETRGDICFRTAIVTRDLATGRERVFPFPRPIPAGTPPSSELNWSPDGKRLALVGDQGTEVLDIPSGGRRVIPTSVRLFAPAFRNADTIVAQAGCCIGTTHLVTIDVQSGRQEPFVDVDAPIESIRVGPDERVILVTALGSLLQTNGRTTVKLLERARAASG